jgi:hypothetical protein
MSDCRPWGRFFHFVNICGRKILPGVAVAFLDGGPDRMKYFGTKQVVEIDENAIAAERLMAIASRFKTDRSSDVVVEEPAETPEAPQAPDQPN